MITAIAKCYSTQLARSLGLDAMDILGGAGISMGPRNLMAVPFYCFGHWDYCGRGLIL